MYVPTRSHSSFVLALWPALQDGANGNLGPLPVAPQPQTVFTITPNFVAHCGEYAMELLENALTRAVIHRFSLAP